MRPQELINLESRLLNPLHIPVIGQCLQKKAVIALSEDRSPEAAKLLAKALTRLKEPEIKESVLDALGNLKNQNCIDAVCEVWADTRHRDLANLLVKKGWIASKPIDLRVITALKIDRLQIIMDGSKNTVEPLLNAFQDKDSEIANRASKCAIIFDRPEYQEFICRLVIEQDHPIARQVAIKAQYSPSESSQKALFCFFTEQWDKYESIDGELSFLQKLFGQGSKELKQRIAEQIKKANRVEWLKIITGIDRERKLEEITDTEWEIILFVLNNNKQWNMIWQLARKAPTIWVKSLLQILDKAKWLPKTEEEQIDFVRLKQLRNKCSEQLPVMGGLTVCQTTLKTSSTKSLFSPDGKLLVTYFSGKPILWQMPEGKLISTLSALDDNNSVSLSDVSFSSDGQLLAGRDYGYSRALLWRMPEGKPISTFEPMSTLACHNRKQTFQALAFSPDGKILVTGGFDTVIKLWRVPEGKLISTLNSPINPIYHLAFSPDGKTLIGYGERESLIGMWRMPEGKLISTLNSYPQKINKVVFSPDSQLLASSGGRKIKLWRTKDCQLVKTIDDLDDFADPFNRINVLKFSPDGQILAGGLSGSIMLWQVLDGKLIKNIDDFDFCAGIWDMDFYPDSKILASGDHDGTIKLFQIPSGEHITTLLYRNRSEDRDEERDGICHMNFSPDGQTLVSCSYNYVVKLWKSDLFRLVNIPVANLDRQDKGFIKKILSSNKCTKEERHWLEFIQALTNQS